MHSYWLLTWTCYGQWLPGDQRGFVGHFVEAGVRTSWNTRGHQYKADLPALKEWCSEQMRGEAVTLSSADAGIVLKQFQETSRIKGWQLEAASIMFNHIHLVLGFPNRVDVRKTMELYKSWATRALQAERKLPLSGRFWTVNGSCRLLKDERAVINAVWYVVKKQPNPLATFAAEHWNIETLSPGPGC